MSSSDESTPPGPNPQNIPARVLNPVWAAAAAGGHSSGRGRGAGARPRGGRGATGSNASDVGGDPPVLGPISLVELEHRHRVTGDGAESSTHKQAPPPPPARAPPGRRRRG
eukprot:7386485-Prymnesium_polylepis.3